MLEWTLAKPLREAPDLPNTERAEEVALLLLEEMGYPGAEVSVLLTDDRGIHGLNQQWRGYDKPTDVLSWPQENRTPGIPGGSELLGDVAISLDTARRQARAREWAIDEEIALLLVHGILHLLGYEDETESGAEAMRVVERRLLGKPLEKTEKIVRSELLPSSW